VNRTPVKRKRSPRRLGLTAVVTGIVSPEKAVEEIVVDQDYRRFVRSLPCARCSTRRRVEFAHQGPRGLSQKTTDYNGVPLCIYCHRLQHSSSKEFWNTLGINLDDLIAQLNRAYEVYKQLTSSTGHCKQERDS